MGVLSVLPRNMRLRRTKDFQKVYQRGRSIGGRYVVLYRWSSNIDRSTKDDIRLEEKNIDQRFGFSVSAKVGKAVDRNHIKRMFRSVCRQYASRIARNHDIILIARHKIKGIPFALVEEDIVRLLKRAKLWTEG